MAVGLSEPSSEQSNMDVLDNAHDQQVLHTPRPVNSPRLLPCKRPPQSELEVEFERVANAEAEPTPDPPSKNLSDLDECSPMKRPRLESQRHTDMTEIVSFETRKLDICQGAQPSQPEASQKRMELTDRQPKPSLEKAVDVAMQLYTDALTAYALDMDLRGENIADKNAERWATERYEQLKNAMLGLLPWVGEMKASANGSYDMIQFQGHKTTRRELCKKQLEHFRAAGEPARAWEALCAVFAVIASRKEKIWLEGTDVQYAINIRLRNVPGHKDKRSEKRRAAIRKIIPGLVEDGAGSFSEYLIDPRTTHVVTFVRGLAGPLPATSLTFRRMPLWDALKCMDDEGPLRGAAADKEWCRAAGRQFAFQDLQFGHGPWSRKERRHASTLEPDVKLRNLLLSKKPVVFLDTLATLAPRDVCKNHGFSAIVNAELETLYREAKARGEGVVFFLGSTNPHKLAEKIYLRPPLGDYGMRCGCLRWRESAEVPWAREFVWDDRITLCLQMP